MNINTVNDSEIDISGQIKSIDNYQSIRQAVNSIILSGSQTLIVRIPDSLSLTSSVIGLFLKVVFEDKMTLKMYVGQERLYNLLEILNLKQVFNVEKNYN